MVTLLGVDLGGKRVVVVGGGSVGTRRALALTAEGAAVTVVSPDASAEIDAAAARGDLALLRRAAVREDIRDAWLVVAATDSLDVNADVARWAAEDRTWCVDASDGAAGSARMPAVSRHGDIAVGVVSLGSPDPRRVAAVRDTLAGAIDDGDLDLRRRRASSGRVILVGSGPGAPDLMTIRARRALAAADVVVADRLGATDALAQLPEDVEVIDVGKSPGAHGATQEEINALLVDHAGRGKTVVRLKGGDPFVFGRGGEELAACIAAGVECEVIPGVTSAFSVPALAGIPVTHRGASRSVLVTTGNEGLEPLAIEAMAEGATVVILMGVAHLADIAEAALAGGVARSTPVAIIERGSTPDARITRTTLARAATDADAAGVASPAIIVVGAVADPELLQA